MYKGALKFINGSLPLCGLVRILRNVDSAELHRNVMDIEFRNPIGIASGFDRHAEYYNALSAMGCSFEIIGPLCYTQSGGIKAAVERLCTHHPRKIRIGINICRNAESSSEEEVAHDMVDGFAYAYDFVDFSVLNFSDKSDGSVHELAFIKAVIDPVLDTRLSYENNKPIVLRLAKTLSPEELESILDYCLMNGIDGVMLESIESVRACIEFSKGRLAVIGLASGRKASEAKSFLDAGASLVALDCNIRNFRSSQTKSILKLLKNT